MVIDASALAKITRGSVVLVGVPSDENSTFMRGAALAPPRIRDALNAASSNLCTESVRDLGADALRLYLLKK